MAASQQTNGQKTVPTLWRERILKRDFEIALGKMLQPNQGREDETEESYLRSANVQWEGVDLSDVKTMWFSSAEKRDLLLREGDLVVNEGGDVGRCAIWRGIPESFYFQNAINRVRARSSTSTRFLYYWLYNLKHAGFIDAMVSRITIAHLTAEKLARVPWPDVPSAEQQRIAAYLDTSCVAIDAAVAAKRRQLETIDALRKTTIHRAVTQGLNPGAKMKSASADWLSEVPAHWTPSRIKNVARLSPGYSGRPPANDEMCTFVPMELLSDAGTVDTSSLQAFEDVSGGLTLFEVGDVLFAKITPCMENGKGAFVGSLPSRYAFGSTEFHVLRPSYAIHGKFLYYYTYNPIFRAYAAENMSGAAGQKRVSSRFLKETRLFVPPPPEQLEIISFLTAKDQELRTLFAQIERQIATLTAYRKSLIHECVTGQRRITEADVVRSQLSAKTGQLNREPYEKYVRLKTAGGDDRTCSANFGKAPKGGGQFVPPLAFKFATADED